MPTCMAKVRPDRRAISLSCVCRLCSGRQPRTHNFACSWPVLTIPKRDVENLRTCQRREHKAIDSNLLFVALEHARFVVENLQPYSSAEEHSQAPFPVSK